MCDSRIQVENVRRPELVAGVEIRVHALHERRLSSACHAYRDDSDRFMVAARRRRRRCRLRSRSPRRHRRLIVRRRRATGHVEQSKDAVKI